MSTPFDHPDSDPTAWGWQDQMKQDMADHVEMERIARFLARPDVTLAIEGDRLAARVSGISRGSVGLDS